MKDPVTGKIIEQRYRPRGPADYFAWQRFRTPTARRESIVTVGNTPMEILKNDPNRVSYTLVNNAGAEISIRFQPEITVGQGVILGAGGGSLQRDIQEDGNAVGDAVWGIAAAAGQSLWVEEIYGIMNPPGDQT